MPFPQVTVAQLKSWGVGLVLAWAGLPSRCHSLQHAPQVNRWERRSVQSLSRVRLSATPWTAAHQASLSITNPWGLLKLMSIESTVPSNHLILCRPLLLPSSIFPGIRVFSNESVLPIRWPKYWSFSFSTSPSSEYSGLISFRKALSTSPLSKRSAERSQQESLRSAHRALTADPTEVPRVSPTNVRFQRFHPLLRPGGQAATRALPTCLLPLVFLGG